jgi:phytanoyl-CoA hydroxylase
MNAMPKAGHSREFGQLREEGYTVLRNIIDVHRDIQPLIDEYSQVLNDLIESLFSAGKLTHAYSGLTPIERMSAFVADTGRKYFDHLSISLPFAKVRPDRPMYLHPAMFHFLRNPRLLDAIEPLLGPEIAVNPFHFMRIKPPERQLPLEVQNSPSGMISKTVWHQDLWGLDVSAIETTIITVWVPLLPADEENGCLIVAPGTHLSGKLEVHCKPSASQPHIKGIPEELVPSHRVPIPANPGDIVLLDRLLEHSSLVNRSNRLRWSCDLRFQTAGQPVGQCGRRAWTARSRSDPEREMTDFNEWQRMWQDMIIEQSERKIPDPTQFSVGNPLCS